MLFDAFDVVVHGLTQTLDRVVTPLFNGFPNFMPIMAAIIALTMLVHKLLVPMIGEAQSDFARSFSEEQELQRQAKFHWNNSVTTRHRRLR